MDYEAAVQNVWPSLVNGTNIPEWQIFITMEQQTINYVFNAVKCGSQRNVTGANWWK